MSWNKPFKLLPASKDYLWGGSRLNDDFNYGINTYPFAEAWVCSTHSDGPTTIPSFGCSYIHLYHSFLDSMYKECHLIFLLLCLTDHSQYENL